MPNAKVERAIELATQLQTARAEVARLEFEFAVLVTPRPGRKVREATTNGHNSGNGKPVRNKLKILRFFQKTEGPVKLLIVRKKLKLSESCLFSNVQLLLKEKQLVKKGHGLYEKA
jgi:hypothetical protein